MFPKNRISNLSRSKNPGTGATYCATYIGTKKIGKWDCTCRYMCNTVLLTTRANEKCGAQNLQLQASMTMGHLLRRRYGMVTSGIQHISALLFLVTGAPEMYQRVRQGSGPDKVLKSFEQFNFPKFRTGTTYLLC